MRGLSHYHRCIYYIIIIARYFSLPTYEASHEFDKRSRRNQAPPGPPVQPLHLDAAPRPIPAPTQPPNYGRPPPPREAFRSGPPLPNSFGDTFPSRPSYPTNNFGHPPLPPRLPPVPQQLPPLVLRPGQPPPPMIWGAPPLPMSTSDRPSHLPPRPAPMRHGRNHNGHHRGRGGDNHDRGGGGSVLNYG